MSTNSSSENINQHEQQLQQPRIAPLFISHGAPTLCIQPKHAMNVFLREKLAPRYQEKPPKAVVVFTAHWDVHPHVAISFHDSNTTYETIHDFFGFPSEMYDIHYKAKGSPKVALRIEQLLQQHSIPTRREFHRGLDHGTWVILNSLFPEANIPVVQCSIDGHQSSVEHHFRIGQALAPLAHENVLVIGSGVTVHNLRKMNWKGGEKQHVQKWVFDFDQWLIDQLLQQRNVKNLFDYEKLAPNARDAVPSEDHFVPLFVPMGMGFSGEFEEATTKRLEPPSITSSVQPQVLERFYDFGCLSYLVISF